MRVFQKPCAKKFTFKVAAVQLKEVNIPKDLSVNLNSSLKFIEKAVEQNANLVLLPELLACGYSLGKELLDLSEKFTTPGGTCEFLEKTSKKYNICVGASFAERDGDDLLNTFVLYDRYGKRTCAIRKAFPAAFERFAFQESTTKDHIITLREDQIREGGSENIIKLGVAICYENAKFQIINEFVKNGKTQIHMLLSPYSACFPDYPLQDKIKIKWITRATDEYIQNFKDFPLNIVKMLNVPVVSCNKTGPLTSLGLDSSFMGLSNILDEKGQYIDKLNSFDEVIVSSEITLNLEPAEGKVEQGKYGSIMKNPSILFFIFLFHEKVGSLFYKFNKNTRKKIFSKLN